MARPNKFSEEQTKIISKNEAFEMIELAIDDLDLLTRAFSMIADVCNEESSLNSDLQEESKSEIVLH